MSKPRGKGNADFRHPGGKAGAASPSFPNNRVFDHISRRLPN
jgi:hypothetical protein